jgi:hypothetical protein
MIQQLLLLMVVVLSKCMGNRVTSWVLLLL